MDPKLLGPVEVFPTSEAKTEFEVEVVPGLIRAVANMLLQPFKEKLLSLSPRALDEDKALAAAAEGARCRRFSKLEIPNVGGQGPILVRCSKEKSVKGTARMGVKVAEALAKGVPFPAINNLGDALRASYCVETAEDVRECWRCISEHFQVLRLKNKAS